MSVKTSRSRKNIEAVPEKTLEEPMESKKTVKKVQRSVWMRSRLSKDKRLSITSISALNIYLDSKGLSDSEEIAKYEKAYSSF